MRVARMIVGLILALACVSLWAEDKKDDKKHQPKPQKLVVTGTLSRAMAIGGETTGWTIQFDTETTVDGKPLHSIEVAYPDSAKLDKLANMRVRAKGKLAHRHGVETGDRVVLEVSKIKAIKAKSK